MNLRKNNSNNILDKLEREAKEILPKVIFDHIAGGAGDENALARNRQAYLDTILIPKVLSAADAVDTRTEILGVTCNAPIIIAPTSFHGLVNKEKELATARAAKKLGCIMTVSMMANTALEQIAQAVDSPLWFQLHIHADRKITESLVNRAEKVGYKAIVVTVDIPQPGMRWRDLNNGFTLPKDCIPANFIENEAQQDSLAPKIDLSGTQFNPSATWEDIKWIKSITNLPILLKGILHYEDAMRAVRCGVDGIIISNHGGRQLDSAIAPLKVLPKIAAVIEKKIPILIDGGIRSGTDVLKAIALGADAVLIGRPILWGLAARGQNGVERILDCLIRELALAMKLVGCCSIQDLKKYAPSIILNEEKIFGDKFDQKDIEDLKKEIRNIAEKQNLMLNLWSKDYYAQQVKAKL